MSITWTTLTSLSFLSTRVLTHVWSPASSPFLPHDRPGLLPGGEPRRGSGPKLGGCDPFGVAWLGDVKPPRLPPLQGLHKGALELQDVGHLANHGTAALRLAAAHHLGLDVEGLEPEAEMGADAEESLAHDDKRQDVEDEIGARS